MIPWITDLEDLKERVFTKYRIAPIYSCLNCPYYEEVKGHELCMKSEDGAIHGCKDAEKIYPKIDNETILELIALFSNKERVYFEFENNIKDIYLNILNRLLQFDADKEFIKGVKRIFRK